MLDSSENLWTLQIPQFSKELKEKWSSTAERWKKTFWRGRYVAHIIEANMYRKFKFKINRKYHKGISSMAVKTAL